jgi:hypothetical protein
MAVMEMTWQQEDKYAKYVKNRVFKSIRGTLDQIGDNLHRTTWIQEDVPWVWAKVTKEFSPYKDLVSRWVDAELTRSGPDVTPDDKLDWKAHYIWVVWHRPIDEQLGWLGTYMEHTKMRLDEIIAAMEKKEELLKATGKGNQYDEVSTVGHEIQHGECGDTHEGLSDEPREVCQGVVKGSCFDVPMEVERIYDKANLVELEVQHGDVARESCYDVPMEVCRDEYGLHDLDNESSQNKTCNPHLATSGGSPQNDGFRVIHARVGLP